MIFLIFTIVGLCCGIGGVVFHSPTFDGTYLLMTALTLLMVGAGIEALED